jgi:hypothetical protein
MKALDPIAGVRGGNLREAGEGPAQNLIDGGWVPQYLPQAQASGSARLPITIVPCPPRTGISETEYSQRRCRSEASREPPPKVRWPCAPVVAAPAETATVPTLPQTGVFAAVLANLDKLPVGPGV